MDRTEAATRVADALHSTEHALDDALGRLAGLLGTVTQVRQDARWSILVGQDAVNEIAAALPEMTVVRDRLIAAHRRLDRWQKRMGVEITLDGGQDKPPPQPQQLLPVDASDAEAPLRRVA
jgi:hypothetical protein